MHGSMYVWREGECTSIARSFYFVEHFVCVCYKYYRNSLTEHKPVAE